MRKSNLKILHYRGIRVFWPKIPLNLTSEGLKYPTEVRVQHETCSTICGTPVQAILDQKKADQVNRGGSGKVKILPRMGLSYGFRALLRPLNGSRTPEIESNHSGAVGWTIWGPFPGSLTNLGASRVSETHFPVMLQS